jgi:hypothetical protein
MGGGKCLWASTIREEGSIFSGARKKVTDMEDPFIMGGDFNLIRYASGKSSNNIHPGWMGAFNDFIGDSSLKELVRKGSKFMKRPLIRGD